MEGKFNGGCHCGQVRFCIEGQVLNVASCHCSICRKANGGVFSSYLVIKDAAFCLVEGGDLLTSYAMSDTGRKSFCSVCGTPIFNRNSLYPGLTIVALGSMDEPAKFAPMVDIFYADRLPWVNAPDGSKCFDQGLQG